MLDDRATLAAIHAVRSACGVARAVQRDLQRVQHLTKDDRSPVTVADFAVQAIVAIELANALGEVNIVGEEQAAALRNVENAAVLDAVVAAVRTHWAGATPEDVLNAIDACDHDASADSFWTLDPVDGTKGFLRGEQYAIALARIEHGHVRLGVLGGPNLPIDQTRPLDQPDPDGVLYWAAAGFGTWEQRVNESDSDPNRIRFMPRDPDDPIRLCESVEKAHSKQSDTERILEWLGNAIEPVRLDSQCKYAVVAREQADAYLRMPTSETYREKIWDHAAGALIASEAGVAVTDIAGAALDFSRGTRLEANRGIVCAEPRLHGRLLEAIEGLGLARADKVGG